MINLYQFQKEYLAGLPPKFIFSADTGTGKTFMALEQYARHAFGKPLLILAPASKVNTGDWERDVKEFFEGKQLPKYEIFSYEKFSRVPSIKEYREKGKIGLWREWLQKYPSGFAVICDEVHRAKNPQSGIGKRVFEISRSCSFFVGLSATPLPNGWIDAANYFKIFGFTPNITAFKKRYCDISTYRGFPVIEGYYREEELKSLWNRISKPLDKNLALDLPDIVTVEVKFTAPKEYITVEKTRIFSDKFLDNPSALMHALRQSTAKAKMEWLDGFLTDASGNIVIFYNYENELESILSLLKKKQYDGRMVYQQNGHLHNTPSKEHWDKLNRTITLAQYKAGSTGVEFTYANEVVYFSPTYSYSDYEQSIGRVYRNGQDKKVTLYQMRTVATIETEVWSAIREKKNFQAKQWFEDKYKEPYHE